LHNLLEFAAKRAQLGRSFSEHELKEIASMHAHVLENLNLGVAVFLRGDERAARQLIDRKAQIWRMENEAAECYFHVFKDMHTRASNAGDVYLRILRDLKRIHSHIATLAYPILDRAGMLQDRVINPHIEAVPQAQETAMPDVGSIAIPSSSDQR
jgi:phosphate:Na+ symporter